jgi:FMN phosphatase YigB (HAD superfamily)
MLKISATASELPFLLDRAPGIEWLSLDCFDTLVWRSTNIPSDVFTELPLEGGGMEPRGWAEEQARMEAAMLEQRGEVNMREIYKFLLPRASEAERDEAIAHELRMEARHAYGFAPVRDLMVEAKKRGLKIMMVSDIYMREAQLRAHIAHACGPEIMELIDRVFASSDYGTGKTENLFTHVMAELGVSPSKILHIGDNPEADQERPSKLGINTVHFQQFAPDVLQRLRLEAAAATLIGRNGTRVTRPVFQLHRPQLSLRTETDPAYCIGHDVLGPIMHGFASWLKAEAEEMEARVGKPVKLLFLLRDGYLPMKAFIELYPELAERATPAEISRFTAFGCSFTDVEAINSYVMPGLDSKDSSIFCKQMAMTPEETTALRRMDPASFFKAVSGPYAKRIIKRSRAFADRMMTYLDTLGVKQGDAVMLVDIGYNGSVQNVIEPVLRDRLGLEVSGRYLALRQVFSNRFDKRGYFDARNYDVKMLTACYESIGVIEEFINLAQGSIVDYSPTGKPIRQSSAEKEAQSIHRDVAQRGCLDYLAGARDLRGMVRLPDCDDAETRRELAAATLVRFLFLPQKQEVEVVDNFHHDVNQGIKEAVRLVDLDKATQSLRQRGIFYSRDMNRIYLPGEMQQHGMHLNLSILSARRFGLDLRKTDFDVGGIELPVMLINDRGHSLMTVDAYPTTEGYYLAQIPIGSSEYIAGVQFGQLYDFVQVDDLTFYRVEDLDYGKLGGPSGYVAEAFEDGMTQVAPGLFQCDAAGFTMVPPPAIHVGPLVLSVVFRPVVARQTAAAEALPSDQSQAA